MRAKKIDANQNLIVEQLRRIGASVAITSMIGKGFPDIVVGFRGMNYLIELKDGDKSKSRKQLTRDEVWFSMNWAGQISICENLEEIIKVITE